MLRIFKKRRKMKKCFLIMIYLLLVNSLVGQEDSGKVVQIDNPNYDHQLADSLGADDYGMKSYFLVILITGKSTISDKEKVNESFRSHMDNINKLVEQNKLIVAGPLEKNDNGYRGIFIFTDVESKEEVDVLLKNDGAIQNGLLDYETIKWYGSAALPTYLPNSDKIWKVEP